MPGHDAIVSDGRPSCVLGLAHTQPSCMPQRRGLQGGVSRFQMVEAASGGWGRLESQAGVLQVLRMAVHDTHVSCRLRRGKGNT